jgi:hypothetical protein
LPQRPAQILEATALAHEAGIQLVDMDKVQERDGRDHFSSTVDTDWAYAKCWSQLELSGAASTDPSA